MKPSLLIASKTEKLINRFLENPSHALMIEAPQGAGKLTVAQYIASSILQVPIDKLSSQPTLIIEPVKDTITIADIRRTTEFMKLKTIGSNIIRRILIVANADSMTIEAQNAFLKLLEEPPNDSLIIITATNIHTLLPTISSRVQLIKLAPVDEQTIIEYFVDQGYAKADVTKALHLFKGQIGRMATLLNNPSENKLGDNVDTAKRLLLATKSERLVEVGELSKNKDELPELLEALAVVCQAGLKASSDKAQAKQIKQWHNSLKYVTEAKSQLTNNPNTKLLLTDLMLNL